jgi:hypothetical protein
MLGIAAAALSAAPISAMAQTWPTSAAALSLSTTVSPPPPALDTPVWRAPSTAAIAAWTPPSASLPALKPPPPEPIALLPDIRTPVKPGWTDDQGFSVHYAQLRYKQRF